MTGMENVLAAHWPVYRWSPIYEANVWACSTGLCDVLGDFEKVIHHQAAELEAAGFGNLHDAWAEGAKASSQAPYVAERNCHVLPANPYRK